MEQTQHIIRCPHCGEAFTIDQAGYADIVQQVRNEEFEQEVNKRVALVEQDNTKAMELAHVQAAHELQEQAAQKDAQIQQLQASIDAAHTEQKLAVQEAVQAKESQIQQLQAQLDRADIAKQLEINDAVDKVERERDELRNTLEKSQLEHDLAQKSLKDRYELQLRDRDDTIERLKELKARLSTKMVGETLEQHCQNEFNAVRTSMFPHAYFEKDNDARTGSKGDFIFRDYAAGNDEHDVEFISIMFEMKNENDSTATKHKNEDFFKELDKDRREKKCEYAVLVSMLEEDSDLYNQGIVDVSYKYPKMYVIRPQFFIQMISLLRNTALNSVAYKQELESMREQQLDITNFEERLDTFKNAFERQYNLAAKHFDKVIDEIDKSIEHLQKVRTSLLGSERSLEQANKRAQEITVRKLTYKNPTMAAKFKEVRDQHAQEKHVETEVVEESEDSVGIEISTQ